MPNFYINSYAPLAITRAGRYASEAYGIPPFVDGSIRREPDFEHPFPAITCLCRGKNFAPRLCVGDIVAYVTKTGEFREPFRHQRLAAILRVIKVLDSHASAATWYRQELLSLPNNLMIVGNSAFPLSQSHRICGTCGGRKRTHAEWDAEYRRRAREFGTVVVCEPLYCDLSWNARVIEGEQFKMALGEVPATRNPGARTLNEFRRLVKMIGIRIRRTGAKT
jgi:hypothetical protein